MPSTEARIGGIGKFTGVCHDGHQRIEQFVLALALASNGFQR